MRFFFTEKWIKNEITKHEFDITTPYYLNYFFKPFEKNDKNEKIYLIARMNVKDKKILTSGTVRY